MDFGLTAEQEAHRTAVLAFAESLNDGLDARDRESVFPHDLWQRLAAFGVFGLPLPETYGGSHADPITIALTMEALGAGCRDTGLLFASHAQLWAVEMPILLYGSEGQRARYLPGLASGGLIGAHAMTEPGSGSDAFSLTTRAIRTDRGYALTGTKTFCTNGPVADVFLIFATVDASQGPQGITAFLVDARTPGIVAGPPVAKMGLRTAPTGDVHLDGCEIAEEQRLGREGAGTTIFNRAMEWERTFILASEVGMMERQLAACLRYVRERRQFGQPIGKFQLVADKVARMKVRLDAARLLLYRAAWAKAQGRSGMLEACVAKLFISEAAVESGLDAIQAHGGYGYATEFGIERDLRDAIGGRLYSGTSEMQTLMIARLLGL
jgi:alkylation response protein AidB-like acyl-CoA dehydrogenase